MEEQKLLEKLTEAARAAGEIMRQATDVRETVVAKEGHANFVTAYDQKVQAFLFDRLSQALPEAHFIGEEAGADQFTSEDQTGYAFCIDPIDGTTNFFTGYRPSVTSIALLRDGQPYMGVVYEPLQDLLFTAIRGQGAYCNGQKLCSSQAPLARSLVAFGTTPYDASQSAETFALCARYLPRCIDLRRSGSAAWDLCCVARGVTGLYFELRLGLWDYAAAALIAREAGCTVTDRDGQPLPYNGPSSVICASPGVAQEPYLPAAL